MCAKYSAEWWEKIPDINREISSRRDPSKIVDDLIQETASGRPSPTRKSKRSRAGSPPIGWPPENHDVPQAQGGRPRVPLSR